jgi:hypothetical protein
MRSIRACDDRSLRLGLKRSQGRELDFGSLNLNRGLPSPAQLLNLIINVVEAMSKVELLNSTRTNAANTLIVEL